MSSIFRHKGEVKKAKFTLKDGKPDGSMEIIGEKYVESMHFSDGKLNGTYAKTDLKGNIKEQVSYVNNKRVLIQKY